MRKFVAIMLVGAVVLFAASASAKIISISVHIDPNVLVPADTAGVVPAQNWNNLATAGGLGSIPNVVDATGAATTIDADISGGGPNSGTEWVVGANPDVTMMAGSGPRTFIDSPASKNGGTDFYVQMELSGGVATTMGGAYDCYLYYGTGYNNPGLPFMGGYGDALASSGEYTVAITDFPVATIVQTVPYTNMHGNRPGLPTNLPTYDAATGYIQGGPGPVNQGNYIVFPALTEENLVLTLQGAFIGGTGAGQIEWNSNTILGVQLVSPDVPVAEPAGLGLLGLALLGLRRRRS